MAKVDPEIEQMAAEVRAEVAAEEGAVEATLPLIRRLRDQRTAIGKDLDILEKPVRDWLDRNGGELVYGEHTPHLVASIEETRGTPVYDVDAIRKDQSLLWKLIGLGCVTIDATAVKEAKRQGRLQEELPLSHYKSAARRLRVEERK